MKKALVIFNGIRFPFSLVDHAIAWAKKNEAALHAVFVKAKSEKDEGYIFPSDLDAAENLSNNDDADMGDLKVIHSQLKVLEDMARTSNIPFTSDILTDPGLSDVIRLAGDHNIIFTDRRFDEEGILTANNFTLKELIKKSSCPVEAVG